MFTRFNSHKICANCCTAWTKEVVLIESYDPSLTAKIAFFIYNSKFFHDNSSLLKIVGGVLLHQMPVFYRKIITPTTHITSLAKRNV
jgi:hypothetical protein